MNCLNCKSDNMVIFFRAMKDFAEDKFKCKDCGNIQLRYSGTQYETEEEKQRRLSKEAKNGTTYHG